MPSNQAQSSSDPAAEIRPGPELPESRSDDRPSTPPGDGLSLTNALGRLSLELPPDTIARLEQYTAALWEWNARLNLTRHTTPWRFASRDLVDALHLAEQLAEGERVLDMGSGGGVPGAVLAIVRPDLKVTLCESVAKKARALAAIVEASSIRARVEHRRAEEILDALHAPSGRFESLTARAVAGLPKLLTWLAPHWSRFDRLLAIKGPSWVEERHAAREQGLFRSLQLRKLSSWPMPPLEPHGEAAGASDAALGGSGSVLLEIRPKAG
jgi:16S rRNA (guanine527-N7)-methyltransferase